MKPESTSDMGIFYAARGSVHPLDALMVMKPVDGPGLAPMAMAAPYWLTVRAAEARAVRLPFPVSGDATLLKDYVGRRSS